MKSLLTIGLMTLLQLTLWTQKTYHTQFTEHNIRVDGHADDLAWATHTEAAREFISEFPVPDQQAKQSTQVKMLYDQEAIYILAELSEVHEDSIMREYTLRDRIGNTDFFGVVFDTYGNGTNGFEFIVSSTGVQFDARLLPNQEDNSWDAVWSSAVSIGSQGWVCELKIPYAAIRFPKESVQKWKVNFMRRRAVSGEFQLWNNVDFQANNAMLTHLGDLTGLEDIEAPIRLSFMPYASAYSLRSRDPSESQSVSSGMSYNMGMDVKWGLNESFTLDMTLIPDFGQARSDQQVLNLSPFEIRFSENRQFFTEGLELFDKSGIFYSRRVGDGQGLFNATKISGRTSHGLGVGVFNAVAKASIVKQEDANGFEIERIDKPLTNYNLVVFDQDLKNNSSITLTNSHVYRQGNTFQNANVTMGNFDIKNKNQTYGINGRIGTSYEYGGLDDATSGYDIGISAGKINGAFTYRLNYEERSQHYNQRDLGFQLRENYRGGSLYASLRDQDGFWKFNQFNIWTNLRYNRNINPSAYMDASFNLGIWAQTKKQANFNIWGGAEIPRQDFYEPREWGRHFIIPASRYGGFWFGSDQRKKLRIQSYGNLYHFKADEKWIKTLIGGNLRYRFSNRFNLDIDSFFEQKKGEQGFADKMDQQIIFGRRNVRTLSTVLNANITFNSKMGFTSSVRHYWSAVYYDQFYHLEAAGELIQTRSYEQSKDLTYDAFTIDAIFNWRFAPGSDLSIVWKKNISGVRQDEALDYRQVTYSEGVRNLRYLPRNNSISLRITFFLDYASQIRGWFRE